MLSNRRNFSNHPIILKKHFKNACIVFTILLACGVLAFGISTIFWYFFEAIFVDGKSTAVNIPLKPIKWQLRPFNKNESQIKNLPPAASCGKRIVGYYTEWESPEVTTKQLQKLTHVIYLFAAIYEDGSARFWDENGEDRFLGMKEKAKNLSPGLKIMIGVGGYMVSPRFAPIVSDPNKRKNLIDDIVAIVDEHQLDGVEIFWIYPTPKFKTQLEDGYDLEKLLEYVDFIDVLTYDYFSSLGHEKQKFGPISPIYGGNGKNVDETMKYLICKTKKPNQFNMAVSFYGSFWRNVDIPFVDNSENIWKYTESQIGAIRWRQLEGSGWNTSAASWHEKSKSSYIYDKESRSFLGMENGRSLKEKIKYAREKKLGGFVIWAIDQDDDNNTLLNVITSADLCDGSHSDKVKYIC